MRSDEINSAGSDSESASSATCLCIISYHFPHLSFILLPSFFFPLQPACTIQWASEASLQLALQADLCHNKTARTLSSSVHAKTHKDMRTHYYECSGNASRNTKEAMLEYKMTALFLFQSGA